ncbi:hypothetical protein KIL84_003424 [Mauremys mutica]|uniref:Uncharacterized protein n=1 Tax=Mauremys mutica TaxID=74926 RepID=A0A9D4ATG6_9SAUR|nr:hypothetical protein KIL84_003424 [Mauremys mutica]
MFRSLPTISHILVMDDISKLMGIQRRENWTPEGVVNKLCIFLSKSESTKKIEEICLPSPSTNTMVCEPDGAQLTAVLQPVATNTLFKSIVSTLQATTTEIQSAQQALSTSMGEAEPRISGVEDDFKENTLQVIKNMKTKLIDLEIHS